MKFTITDLVNAEKFVHIFQHLKNFANNINIDFMDDKVYIQGMDGAHVSLYEISLDKSFFDEYSIDSDDTREIGVNNVFLYKILNTRFPNQTIEFSYEGDPDYLNIDFDSEVKNEFNKSFQLPLMELDIEKLHIPSIEYQADLVISTTVLTKMIDEFAIFDEKINIKCNDESINFKAVGVEGNMNVELPIEDVEEYLLEEDGNMDVTYSIKHFQYMCSFNKLSDSIKMGFSDSQPMLISYEFADCFAKFYLAPSISED